MSQISHNIRDLNFKPHQIVCLESSDERLYGEVIQIIEQRQTCWVRPLVMVQKQVMIADLRSSSDLILPLCLFRSCFDTEIIPFLTELHQSSSGSTNKYQTFNLNLFVQQVWRTNGNKF